MVKELDIVNEFFHKFYPEDYKTNWETRWCGSDIGREYQTLDRSYIFPKIICNDGFGMSVQGHFGAYSFPRDDFADFYTNVEILIEGNGDTILNEFGRVEVYDTYTLYPYIPISYVIRCIESHGGIDNSKSQ